MTAFVVVGLGFGDCGKGSIVDSLVKKYNAHTVVRFNGGAQAAHNVVHDDDTHHTFNQFGSGTFRGAKTHMTRHCLLNPYALKQEAEILRSKGIKNPLSLFTVHEKALVTTPYHMFLNGIREEARGLLTHGSCGMGIGETMSMHIAHPTLSIFAKDIRSDMDSSGYVILCKKIKAIERHVFAEAMAIVETAIDDTLRKKLVLSVVNFITPATFELVQSDILLNDSNIVTTVFEENLLEQQGDIILEGAQGVLLDEWFGFHPHTTWSTTLYDNALHFLQYYNHSIVRIGVTRAYSTRHGNGPFPTYSKSLTLLLPDRENITNRWQGAFKAGSLDLSLLQYATKLARPDFLAVTCMDRLGDTVDISTYDVPVRKNRFDIDESASACKSLFAVKEIATHQIRKNNLLSWIEMTTGVKTAIISRGPKADDKEFAKDDDIVFLDIRSESRALTGLHLQ